MKRALYLPILVVMTIHTPLEAVFCSVYHYANPTTGNHLWLLGDIHVDISMTGILSHIQKNIVLKEAKKKNALIIAENASFANYGPYIAAGTLIIGSSLLYCMFSKNKSSFITACITGAGIVIWSHQQRKRQLSISVADYIDSFSRKDPLTELPFFPITPLIRLVEDADARGIDAHDLEFRYHMLKSSWIMKKITGDTKRHQVTVQDYCSVNDAVIKTINDFKSTPLLHTFYKNCIDQYYASYVTHEIRDIARINPDQPLTTLVPHIIKKYNKDHATAWKEFIEHNRHLLDALIIHDIHSNQSRKHLFVCAGFLHTEQYHSLLEKMGYKKLASHGDPGKVESEMLGAPSLKVKNLRYFALDLEKIFV